MRLVLALLAVLAAPAGAQDPVALQLFSGVDAEAVPVGGTVAVTVEALAAPVGPAEARALAQAFRAWDPGPQLGPGLAVVRSETDGSRVTGDVVELRRRLWLRVQDAGVAEVPALRFEAAVGGRAASGSTRPHAVRAYAADGRVGRAVGAVVAVTAEGVIDGVAFTRVGSAFAVGGDALVTAYHVVVGAERVRARLPDGTEVATSRAWALDPARDVAVLHVDADQTRGAGLQSLTVAPAAASGGVAFTAGRRGGASAAPRYADLDLGGQRVRMSANAVSPGDSGGPLLDDRGRVLGVVVAGRGDGLGPDVLRQTLCLAADPGPALRHYRAASGPVPLARALAAAEATAAGRAHRAAGALALADRRPPAARRSSVDALRRTLQGASDATLLFMAGEALAGVGDPLAVGALDASRRGGYVPAGYALAHLLLDRGHLAMADEVFAEAARDGAYHRLAAFGRAQALVGMGRYTEAEGPLAVVLDHDARFAPALVLLGVVRLAQGREAEARALVVRLADQPVWADALRGPVEMEALRPPRLDALPRVALR